MFLAKVMPEWQTATGAKCCKIGCSITVGEKKKTEIKI